MRYLELNRDEAKKIFDSFVSNGIPDDYFDSLNDDYKKIRSDILSMITDSITKTYDFDLKFGIKLHAYFNAKNFEDFNEAIVSNYDFWRYLCLKVVPDVIYQRHGYVKEYFYDKNVRMYLPTIWWYIHFGEQGNEQETYDALKGFSTDYILNIVERPGREGLYIDVIRLIIKYLTILPKDIVNQKVGNQILLRRVMLQNTARIDNYNLIIENKADDYVVSLFKKCGVEVKEYA